MTQRRPLVRAGGKNTQLPPGDTLPKAALPALTPADVGAVAAGDSRLTDAREWTAATVSQAEAEAGTASTRRAWTAQRVRQAVVAWWGTIGTTFGKSLLSASNAAAGLSLLGAMAASLRGVANGVASLDSGAKVPLSQLPDAILGQLKYQGIWNASTNSPALPSAPTSSEQGHYYVVGTAGTRFSIDFGVGDWIVSNGSAWGKVDNTDAVMSVNGRMGNVTGLAEAEDVEEALDGKEDALPDGGTVANYLNGNKEWASFVASVMNAQFPTDLDTLIAAATDTPIESGDFLIDAMAQLQVQISARVTSVSGKGLSTEDYSTVEKSKLSGIATGATANDTDGNLKNRDNHTGTQAISTVTGLQSALDGKLSGAQKQLCTAWVNFDGGGTPTIRDSYNITSITDLGTGQYTASFGAAMANTNYAVIAGSNDDSDTTASLNTAVDTQTLASFRIRCRGSSSFNDRAFIRAAVFGGGA